MGVYLNPGNDAFRETVNSEIYVDKTGLLEYTNRVMETEDKYICVSRPRRFGKSIAAKMLAAYYDRSCDSHTIFDKLEIAKTASYEDKINQSDVLYLDISWFRTNAGSADRVVSMIQRTVIRELQMAYPEAVDSDNGSLPMVLADINSVTRTKFVVIIDEWDCLFREDRMDRKSQEEYIELLRGLFKGGPSQKFIKLAYLTGILPIKKYGTQSALNNFKEYTMVKPLLLAEYVGFTEAEVQILCRKYHMDFSEAKQWYDGYSFNRVKSVYSPNSVVQAMRYQEFGNYWTETETYEDLKTYINMNFDGLRDAVISMIGGGRCRISTRKFQNDMANIKNRDDVMTLLVHLGYLAFDEKTSEVYIPNQEVSDEFANAVEDGGWEALANAIRDSSDLLDATIHCDEAAVAAGIDKIHTENTSILSYNNEQSLSCVITIAYYSARKDYMISRELPTGKGFADMVFIPRREKSIPALIIELKWNQSAQGAIAQIKNRCYAGALSGYTGDILMVGINYDKKMKKHTCMIEKWDGI
ncbi:MAG: AAA family ATPase [Lachnospiraceae bacterium]|nr:AAA family ATPase [Lachnospiraceae bacterium]MDY4971190.1 AAA family ATPase [Lachnospiraceae bacterium]